jgi:uncharacterized repeat protein (TIGR01451 family)
MVTSAPAIAVFRSCPTLPIPKGSTYTYTGTVTNTGNSTLVEVMVYDSVPSNRTPVLGPITLAPGTGASFTGSYLAPRCCCYLVDTLTAIGRDRCSLEYVSNTSSSLCPLQTTPGLTMVLTCPTSPLTVGTVRAWSGFITNMGDVNLTNVYVVANYPATNTPVLGPLELAPGEIKLIAGTFVVPEDLENNPLVVSVAGKDTCTGQAWLAQEVCTGGANTAPLSLTVHGSGTVSGAANGQQLVVGRRYTLTAIPGSGATFLNWSGDVSGSNPVVSFVMAQGLAVVANFSGTSPGVEPGTFNGLFYDTNGVVSAQSGSFTLTVDSKSKYSGSLRMAGKKYSVSGTIAADSRATNTISRSGTSSLQVLWDFSITSGVVVGTVGDGTWLSQLLGDVAVWDSKSSPCPLAGNKYTVIFPGTGDGTTSPEGDGYGKVSIDGNGKITLSGTLADGTSVSQTATLSAGKDWPLYLSLYSNKGLLIGWLEFADQAGSDLSGKLSWIKPSSSSKYYPSGFDVHVDTVGSRYIAPSSSSTVLVPAERVLMLIGGDLPADVDQPVTLQPGGKVTTGVEGLSMSFKTSDGSFSGSYKPAGASKSYSFKGAALQKANTASGYILGTSQSGRANLEMVK